MTSGLSWNESQETRERSALESEYLELYCQRLTASLEQLLIGAHVLAPEDYKENDGQNIGSHFRVALEQSGLDTKVSR